MNKLYALIIIVFLSTSLYAAEVTSCPQVKRQNTEDLKLEEIYQRYEVTFDEKKDGYIYENVTKLADDNLSVQFKYELRKYIFLGALAIEGLKPYECCRRNGREVSAKIGFDLKLKFANHFGLLGNVNIGFSHQEYIKSDRNKYLIDLREFYVSTRDPFEPLLPGFILEAGRVPVREDKGFWYNNSLDGAKIRYHSTLLKSFIFFGTRLEDLRVSNTDEKNSLDEYNFIIGNINYQYHYNQILQLYYIKEYKDKKEKIGREFTVWESSKPYENLNWLGIGLGINKNLDYTENSNRFTIWGDLGYMWGKTEFVNLESENCNRADRKVKSAYAAKVKGLGGEVGGGYKKEKWGIGARFSAGEGDKNLDKNSRNFFQTRISHNRDTLFGPSTIKSYGYLTNPDLRNLYLVGVFGGVEVSKNIWFELNLLKYEQYAKANSVSFSKYFVSPNGKDSDLGWEADFIFEGEKKTDEAKWNFNVALSYFRTGDAFDGTTEVKDAYGVFMGIKRYW